jgi:hypothetical protein
MVIGTAGGSQGNSMVKIRNRNTAYVEISVTTSNTSALTDTDTICIEVKRFN